MRYVNHTPALFLSRPNRFIAKVELGGREETVHVKNTGRCRELLTPGAPVWLQVVWFLVVSIAALALTRPLAKKFVNARTMPTNADRILGTECLVTEAIDNLAGTGAVSAGGKTWTARSVDGSDIPVGTLVTVQSIEGVKAIVSASAENKEVTK